MTQQEKIYKSNKIKVLCLILTLIFSFDLSASNSEKSISAPQTNPLFSMPLPQTFWQLFRQRNIIGKYDCSNKCGQYTRLLREQGFEADIVVIHPNTGLYLHAVVKLTKKDGSIQYLDPTRGTMADDLAMMGRLKETILFENLEAQGEQYM